MMDFQLSADEEQIRDLARNYAQTTLAERALAHDAGAFPMETVKELAGLGLMGIKSPVSFGGLGGSNVAYALAIREIAKVCASTAVTTAVTNMVGDMLVHFGDDGQRERWLRPLLSGEFAAGSFALTEPSAGSDAASLSSKAVLSDDGSYYTLSGTKMWITSGDVAGAVLVMAKTDADAGARGISAFIVDPNAAGFHVGRHEQKMGLKGSSTVSLTFESVKVPAADRLGPEGIGFRVAMTALDGGRCGIGAQALGIAESALGGLLAAMPARKADDRALGTDQAAAFRIADMATRMEAAWLMVLRACALKDAGKVMSREAAMAKVFATEAAGFVTKTAMGLAGADGLRKDSAIGRAYRDARVARIYEGTSEVQRIVIARSLVRGV
ncbi:MAG: acyl-CoA dehydrogenase family protein [Myxococcales bacterium]|nr:acyl-CoA dehydrogenase family protein [Myxococcales bacterium]